MHSTKQQAILHFLNKDYFSFQKRTTVKVDMKQAPVLHLQQSARRECTDMLIVAGWTKNRNGDIFRQYDKKYLDLALL